MNLISSRAASSNNLHNWSYPRCDGQNKAIDVRKRTNAWPLHSVVQRPPDRKKNCLEYLEHYIWYVKRRCCNHVRFLTPYFWKGVFLSIHFWWPIIFVWSIIVLDSADVINLTLIMSHHSSNYIYFIYHLQIFIVYE